MSRRGLTHTHTRTRKRARTYAYMHTCISWVYYRICSRPPSPLFRAFKNQFGGSSVSIAASESKSTIFLKKFFAVAISNVAYLRGIMSEESFSDRLGSFCLLCVVVLVQSEVNFSTLLNPVTVGFWVTCI